MIRKYTASALIIMLMALVVLLPFELIFPTAKKSDKLTVTFLDVGQGDCSLIRIGDKTLLIDGGEGECAEADILPFMLDNGIEAFDSMMASHYHSDHGGGIYELLKMNRANRLIIPDVKNRGSLGSKLMKEARYGNVEVMEVTAGDGIDMGNPEIKLDVLFPDGGIYHNDDENKNNDSIVLRLDYYDTAFLFTGDLESDAEAVLVNSGSLDADVLKVGHHGSVTSTSQAFLEAVSPQYAVIQAGENNEYGHPHGEVVKRLRDFGSMIYRTDKNGDIIFEVDQSGIVRIEPQYR